MTVMPLTRPSHRRHHTFLRFSWCRQHARYGRADTAVGLMHSSRHRLPGLPSGEQDSASGTQLELPSRIGPGKNMPFPDCRRRRSPRGGDGCLLGVRGAKVQADRRAQPGQLLLGQRLLQAPHEACGHPPRDRDVRPPTASDLPSTMSRKRFLSIFVSGSSSTTGSASGSL